MKGINRGMAVVLAVLLIFSAGNAFAANPNAMKNKESNPAMMKSIIKVGVIGNLDLDDLKDAIDIAEIKVLPTESPNVVKVVGSIEIDKDYKDDFTLDMFKGNTKLKLKFGNVTVNVDKYGDFKQTMPLWKLEGPVISLYMGHVFLYEVDEDIIDEMDDPIPVERALERARIAVGRIPRIITVNDRNIIERARVAVDLLKAALDAENIKSGIVFDEYKSLLAKVEKAEDSLEDILEGLIGWENLPRYTTNDTYSGRLYLNSILPSRVKVVIDFVDTDETDLELTPSTSGRFSFESDTNKDIVVKIYLDDIEIESLRFTIDVD